MEDLTIIKGLYAITPDQKDNDLLTYQVEQAIKGGVKLIQYRAKSLAIEQKKLQAIAIKDLCDKYSVRLIVNDDAKLASNLDAFGVHLGKQDENIDNARKILGPDKCIGVSCYDSITRAKKLCKKPINYIAFGAFFPTTTKPNVPIAALDLISKARKFCNLPIVAIGGITLDNISILLDNNIKAVALISSIFKADNIEITTREFCNILERGMHE